MNDTVWHVRIGKYGIDSAYVIASNPAYAVWGVLNECPYVLDDIEAETFAAENTFEETDDLTEAFMFDHHFCGWTECGACGSRISQSCRDDVVIAETWVYCNQACADKGPKRKNRKPESIVWLSTEY